MAKKFGNGIDLQNTKLINLADPSAATDAANKQYVDNVAAGLAWKFPVKAASTTNVNLSTPGASLDGVTLTSGDRILLKDQTTGAQNGIYVWQGSAVALVRSTDADSGTELNPGTAVTVTAGTVNADLAYMVISDNPVTIGTTATVWGLFSPGVIYTASNGVQKTGNNFQGVVAPSGGLTVGASGFAIDTAVVVRKAAGTFGNGTLTTIPITHNLGTQDVSVTVRIVATNEGEETDWVATDANTVTFYYNSAPPSNSRRFVIQA